MIRIIGRPALVISLLMLLVLALFTFPLWSSSRLPYQGGGGGSEVTELSFPAQYFMSSMVKDGSLPLWNPYTSCGFPVLAEGQSGALYPVSLVFSLVFDPVSAYNLSIIIALLLSLAFSYLLFRHYDISRASSLFSAIAYAFSGFMVTKLRYPSLVAAFAWLPLAVYGLEKSFSRRHLKYLVLVMLALAMQFLAAGFPAFLLSVSVLVLVFSWRFICLFAASKGEPSGIRRRLLVGFLVAFLLSLVLGSAIAAPQLLPATQGAPYIAVAGSDGSFTGSTSAPMRPRDLQLFVNPYSFGNPSEADYDAGYDIFWENTSYPGLLTMVLALVAVLFLLRKDRTLQMWLLIGLLALGISLGSSAPLARYLWQYIPGFKSLFYFQRFLLVTVLAIAILAGKGLDVVSDRLGEARAWKAALTVLVFIALVADLGIFARSQVSTVDAAAVLDPQGITEQALVERDESPQQRIAVLGYGEAWDAANDESGGWLGEKNLFLDCLRLLPSDFNVISEMPGAQKAGHRILGSMEAFWIFDTFGRVPVGNWEMKLPDSTVNLLAVQGIRYLLTPYKLDHPGLVMVKEEAGEIAGVTYRTYELPGAAPRVYFADEIVVDTEIRNSSISQLVDIFGNPLEVTGRVIIEEETVVENAVIEGAEARIIESSPTRVVIEAECPSAALLVLNDSYFPEWKAYVDGQETYILRANLAFRAVELRGGKHTVEFVYRPVSFYYGIFLAVASILLLLLLLLYNRQSGWLDLQEIRMVNPDTDDERPPGEGEDGGDSPK